MFSIGAYLTLAVLFLVPAFAYYGLQIRCSYWRRKGVPYIPAIPLLGNMRSVCLFQKSVAETFDAMYNDVRTKEAPAVGFHIFTKPALLVRDLELIKLILVKDFASFNDRISASDTKHDMIGGGNLFFVKNPTWKTLRTRLTTVFTSGKMKQMFVLMNEIGGNFNKALLALKVDEKTQSVGFEFREICARYSTDIIASCAFGLNSNSLQDPLSEFRRIGGKIFKFTWFRAIEFISAFFLPQLFYFFRFKVFGAESSGFLRDSITYTLEEREKSGEVRNDLIDTLLKLRSEDKDKPHSSDEIVFQGDALVAQASVFFAAGFETTATVLSFGLFELSRRPELQQRLRAEIQEVLKANNGELTYDIVHGMEYLGMIVSEVIRKYPSLPFLDRECTISTKDSDGYSLQPFLDFKVPNGMPIVIPIYSIHRDPRYWPNPDHFDPERFSPENRANILPYTYLPFGTGPRVCIGDRFGILQSRLGFINFFRNHRVEPSEKTPVEVKLDPQSLLLQAQGGMHLNVIRDPLFKGVLSSNA